MSSIAIIGAGPYGLSLAAHLRARGVPHRVFGPAMETWRQHVPEGMLLKSDGFASNLSAPDPRSTLAAYCAEHDLPYHDTDRPIPLATFNAYASAFQQRYVPHLEEARVVALDRKGDGFRLELDTGEVLESDIVVSAVGVSYFGVSPDVVQGLATELVTHSHDHSDLASFAGRDVTVIGGGASAIDLAALLGEAGARTSLVARSPELRFSEFPSGTRTRLDRLRHPSTGIGPGLRSYAFQHAPHLFRFLPGRFRTTIVRRHLGPKAAGVMKPRLEANVSLHFGEELVAATAAGDGLELVFQGSTGRRTVRTGHLVAATGYWPRLAAIDFLGEGVRSAVRSHTGAPMLTGHFESSVPGLYFVGPAAVDSFGPLMRFMVGAEYAAPRLARHLDRLVGGTARDQAGASP